MNNVEQGLRDNRIGCKKCDQALWKLYQRYGKVAKAICANCGHKVELNDELKLQDKPDPLADYYHEMRMFT